MVMRGISADMQGNLSRQDVREMHSAGGLQGLNSHIILVEVQNVGAPHLKARDSVHLCP
jgi:hypothetical protein